MFARLITMNLKSNRIADFTKTVDEKVIPLLRTQKGFQDLITFVDPNGTQALGISVWDRKENAESYNRETYPAVLKALASVLEGSPQVKTYELTNSTFPKLATHATV